MAVSGGQGTASQDERRGQRVIRRVQIFSGVGTLVVLVTGAVLISSGIIPSPFAGGPVSSWRRDVSGVGLALTVLLFVIGAVVALRAGMRPFRHPTGIWALRRGQYQRSAHAVRRGAPAPAGEIAATLTVARSMTRMLKGLLLFAALTLDLATQALVMANVWWAALTWLAVALFVAGMLYAYRDGRLAQRWLHAHHAQSPSEPAHP